MITVFRNIQNPAFGPLQIRELSPIFFMKAFEVRVLRIFITLVISHTDDLFKLRDVLVKEINKGQATTEINIVPWLNKCALDMIGLAGEHTEDVSLLH